MKIFKLIVVGALSVGLFSGFTYGHFMMEPTEPYKTTKTQKQIKVMVIDSGIGLHKDLKPNVQYDTTLNYLDSHGHGTHIAGIVLYGRSFNDKLCDSVKIYSCRYYDPTNAAQNNMLETIRCINRAIDENMDYINYSGGGLEPSIKEFEAYQKFIKQGGHVVVAAGNESSSLLKKPYYPASYSQGFFFKRVNKHTLKVEVVFMPGLENFTIVESECEGKLCVTSNSYPLAVRSPGKNIYSTLPSNQYGYMTGTSQATADVLHFILKQRCESIKNSVLEVEN